MTDEHQKDFLTSDEEKRKLINAAGSEKDHKGADAVVVYDHNWGLVEVSGLGNLYHNRLIKILTEKGAAQHHVLRFDYDPRSYINDVLKLRIHRKGGGIEEVDAGVYADVMQPESMLYWRVKMKLYNLPLVEVGDAIEWETFKKGFNVAYLSAGSDDKPAGEIDPDTWVDPHTGIKPPMYGAFYDIVYFRERIPVKDKRYTLVAPRSMPLSFEFYHGDCRSYCLINEDTFTYSWEKKDIEGYKPEPRMPGMQAALPKLLVSTIHNWKEKSRWFYRVNESQFGWNDEIKALVDRVTATCRTDDEKAAALLHWVAQEIRYIGFSVCQGEGYTLHEGVMTCRERGGVCKDLAGMLVTMLRAAGLESYAAQTQAIQPVNRIPADQFDHCVTAWRKSDGSWEMLDPTWAPFSMEIWDAAETLQNYLIGSPEGEDLRATKFFTPEESLLKITASSRLLENGAIEGHVNYWGRGRSDSSARFLRAWQPGVTLERAYRKMVASMDPGAELATFKTSDPNDLKHNYQTDLDYRIDAYGVAAPEDILFRIPMSRFMRFPGLVPYLSAAEEPERKFDLLVVFMQLAEVEERIAIPAGYCLAGKPVNLDIKRDMAEFQATLIAEPGQLIFKSRFIIKVRTISKDAYKEFKELVDKSKELAERWITLHKTSDRCC